MRLKAEFKRYWRRRIWLANTIHTSMCTFSIKITYECYEKIMIIKGLPIDSTNTMLMLHLGVSSQVVFKKQLRIANIEYIFFSTDIQKIF